MGVPTFKESVCSDFNSFQNHGLLYAKLTAYYFFNTIY
ncbi:hypothetical protein LEP1GSC083_5034 [Leptospira interrogans serovar Pyrogenes str. L0374]|uniref:Uncharacterized protein n=1 Tax=Leptospira interrogans serovar Pyrogenes str. L0374 TaxID=1049928 RepID=M6KDL3_LEPIR|nr:hypothetical protein LEP1GSC083_5034 [Leptospira interrogans serovar Pyrogenes str. L0374]